MRKNRLRLLCTPEYRCSRWFACHVVIFPPSRFCGIISNGCFGVFPKETVGEREGGGYFWKQKIISFVEKQIGCPWRAVFSVLRKPMHSRSTLKPIIFLGPRCLYWNKRRALRNVAWPKMRKWRSRKRSRWGLGALTALGMATDDGREAIRNRPGQILLPTPSLQEKRKEPGVWRKRCRVPRKH